MKVGDYSPPSTPSLDQRHDALRKGLGRALLWAVGGRLGDEALLGACLRDQRFDGQVEGPRGTLNSSANACSGRVWIPSNVELSG